MSHAHISSLSIWRDRFIYMSPYFLGEQSCRPSTVILIGTDGDFELESSGNKHSGRAFLIGSNVARTLSANNTSLYSLNVDPINPYARKLREVLNGQDILDLQPRMNETAGQHARNSMSGKRTCHELRHSSEVILQALFPEIIGAPPLDRRVDMVASWLHTHIPQVAELKKLSALCGLSESRLTHLFTDEVGISIRQYLLWIKMRYAAELFVRNKTLSEVAHEIGFSDSSHLSRTFTRYFALTPSYLANNKLVELQICDDS